MSSTALLPFNGGQLLFTQSSSFPNYHRSATLHKWGWTRHQGGNVVAYRTNGHVLQNLTNPNVSSRKGSNNEVTMVDPLEAKRLAIKQMEEIKAKEKYKRKRQIEAVNGAWAMIGLTAGLLIEAQTGKSILTQLSDYWSLLGDFKILSLQLSDYWSLLGDFKIFSLQLSDYWNATVNLFLPYRDLLDVWLKN